jgi:4-hydroxy-3-polyprenylbenzoate decarboxylase
MYRMQVYDGQTTGMHWQRQKVAAEHFRERLRMAASENATGSAASARIDIMAQTAGGSVQTGGGSTPIAGNAGGTPSLTAAALRGERMEVAVAIGTDPATTFSAIVPAPPEVEEYIIAGFLRQAPVELVQCETVDLQVPAHAEIVLEGYVELGEMRSEGPFGDHTGFSRMIIRSFTSPASRIARTRYTPRPSWANRPWKTRGWVWLSNVSFCR